MAWHPLSHDVQQYVDTNGDPYSGAVLKVYEAGTSTPTDLATDSGGGTTVASIALNADGYPEVSGNIVIPHIDQDYKLALYPTQTAADANTGAVWTIDNIDILPAATDIVYTPGGAGAVDTTVQAKLREMVSVTDFGAVGDGVTDDTAAIQAAVNAGNYLHAPDGVYLTTSEITRAIDEDMVIYGPGIIKNVTSDIIFSLYNTAKVTTALDGVSDATNSFDIVNGTGVQIGDLMVITSTKSWDAASANYVAGELLTVLTIVGNIVTTTTMPKDTYLNTDVVKFYRPVSVHISNFGILGDTAGGVVAGQKGLYLANFVKPVLDNVEGIDTDKACISLSQCLGATINSGKTSSEPLFAGFSYGLVIGSSADTTVIGGSYKAGRHGVTHGGTFPCRNNRFFGVEIGGLQGTSIAGFDTHENAEDTYLNGCNLTHGIANSGRNTIYEGCNIKGLINKYLSFDDYHPDKYFKLINCDIENIDSSLPTMRVIPVGEKNAAAYLGEILLQNCTINGNHDSGVKFLEFTNDYASTTVEIGRLHYDNTVLTNVGAGSTTWGIDHTTSNTYTIDEVLINNQSELIGNSYLYRIAGVTRFRLLDSKIGSTEATGRTFQMVSGDLFEIDGCNLDITGDG